MTTPATQKPLNPDTRLARLLLPDIDPHSPLLPTNKWILSTLKDLVKTHAGIRRCVTRAAGFALGGLAALGAGLVGAVLAPGLAVAGAIGAVAVATAAVSGFFVKRQVEKIKADHMGDIQEIVKNKYLEMKANELKRAWRERAEQVRRTKETQRAAEAARKAAEAKAAAEAAAQEKQAQAKQEKDPKAAASGTKKKASLFRTFGHWAALKAKEGAHALEDKLHDALEDKPANTDTPPQTPPDAATSSAPKPRPCNAPPPNGG